MINSKNREFIGPKNAYGSDTIKKVEIFDPDHTPYNKRKHEVWSSTLTASFTSCAKNNNNQGWVEIRLNEITTVKEKGKTSSRNITITLSAEEKQKLIEFLQNN